ncbi:MAG: hypothetical protein Q4G64_06455 [bacterium]|nr:hypothetical protein [bacterium]
MVVEADPWAAAFEAARAEATSDFERQVLEDNEVTRAEYEEGVALYLECLRDRGFQASATEVNGSYSYMIEGGGEDVDTASHECAIGTTWVIAPLYGAISGNPDNTDPNQQSAECFVRNGLAEPGFDGAAMEEWIREGSGVTPSGHEMGDPEVTDCLVNPTGDLGDLGD